MHLARVIMVPPGLFLSLFIPVAIIVGYPILKVLYVSIYILFALAFAISFLIYGREPSD